MYPIAVTHQQNKNLTIKLNPFAFWQTDLNIFNLCLQNNKHRLKYKKELMNKMFVKATCEEVGISSKKVLEYIKTLESYNLKTHSIIMARGNKIFAETYYAPFNKDFKHRMYSVSKSFVAIGVGLAEQEGLLSLDDKFMDYFPEYINENVNDRFFEATIKDMLSMQTFMVDYGIWWGKEDRAKAYFTKSSRQIPGTNFFYDSSGSFLLGCLVEKVTKKPLLEYLKEKVLIDIGFSKDSYCLIAPGGHSHSDSGVMCTSRDLLIFARLLMNKGEYNGKRYINEKFMTDVISKQTETNCTDIISPYDSHGYGYFVWKMPRDGFALFGMANQYAICDTKTDFIFIINSENMDNNSTSKTGTTIILHELYKTIINNLDSPLSENKEDAKELEDYLSTRKLICLEGETKSPILNKINGVKYVTEPNPMGIEYIKIDINDEKGIMEYKNKDGINKLEFGMGYNVFSKFPGKKRMSIIASVYEDGQYDCATSAIWNEENKLHILSQIIDTYMGSLFIALGFKDDRVSISMHKHSQRILDEYSGYAIGKKEI